MSKGRLIRYLTLPDDRQSSLEFFQCYVCEAEGALEVRWSTKDMLVCLSEVQHTKHGTTLAHLVWRPRKHAIQKALQELEFDSADIIDSARSLKAKGVTNPNALDVQTFTTIVLFVPLACWSLDLKDGRDKELAAAVLDDLLRVAVGRLSLDFACCLTAVSAAAYEGECSDPASGKCRHLLAAGYYERLSAALPWPSVRDALLALWGTRQVCQHCSCLVGCFLEQLSGYVDDRICGEEIGSDKPDSLPFAVGCKRKRHMDAGRKDYILSVVRDGRFRSVSHAFVDSTSATRKLRAGTLR